MTTPTPPGAPTPPDPHTAHPNASTSPGSHTATPPGPNAPTPQDDAARRRSVRIIWLLAAVVVIALVGLFVLRLSAPESGDPSKAEASLAKSAELLAGTGEAAALARATCTSEGDDEYDCVPAGVSGEQKIRIVLLPGGAVAERLAGTTAGSELRSGQQVADALAADAAARGLGNPSYACGTTLRMGLDGAIEQGAATGFLCVADRAASGETDAGGADTAPTTPSGAGGRYIEFNADGLATRDYAVNVS